MSRPGDNPLVALLQMRSRRRGHPWFRPSAWLGAGLALGLGGLGALGARWMVFGDDPSALAHTLAGAALGQIIGAAVLLLALPLTGSAIDRSLLRTLRLGRCWDEVLTGRYSLAELVDGLVRHRLAQTAWQAAGYTVAALPFCWAAGSSYLLTLLAFLPAVLLVSLWVGYFSLATVGWSEGEEGLGALQMVPLAAIFGPGAFLASIPRAGLPLGYLYSLWMSRRMALAGLARNPSPGSTERAWRRLWGGGRNRWVRPFCDNPVVVRESARLAGLIPLGLAGALVCGYGFGLAASLLLGLGAWALEASPESGLTLLMVTLALAWGQFLRAQLATLGALAREREQATLEPLLQTGLSSREFVDGWAALGWLPRLRENLLPAALILAMAGHQMSWPQAGAALAALALGPLAGAYLGLSFAAATRTRREALQHCIACDTGLFYLAILAGGVALALCDSPLMRGPLAALIPWLTLFTGALALAGLHLLRAYPVRRLAQMGFVAEPISR